MKQLGLLLAASCVALLLGECAVRIARPQSVAVPWQDQLEGVTCPRPSLRGRHAIPGVFDVELSYSSQRFRGARELSPQPAAGTLRVAVLGDSFTFGYGANDDEAYPAVLEALLSRRLGRSVEVINAANGGTGTGEQALWYELAVARFAPQVVLLTVVSNDVDDDLARGLFVLGAAGEAQPVALDERRRRDEALRKTRGMVNALPGYGWLVQRSQLANLLRNAASAVLGARRRTAAGAPDVSEAEQRRRFVELGLPLLAAELRYLRARVERARGLLLVAFVPSRESVDDAETEWTESVRWRSGHIVDTLRASGLGFADWTAAMRARGVDHYYSGLDSHPNPAGYRAIAELGAELIARELESGG